MIKLRNVKTYHEFVNFADKGEFLDGKWVYRYIAYIVDSDLTKPYPEFMIEESTRVLFLSLADAEAYMKEFIHREMLNDDEDSAVEFYCHKIAQIPIGDCEYHEGSVWLYDSYGNQLDYHNNQTYFGRTSERQRFHFGDIVEVIDGNRVRLAVVSYPPLTVDECWQRYKDASEDYLADPLDDSCIVRYGPRRGDFDHVIPVNIMKPHFFVTEELKNEMRQWQEKRLY